MPYEPIKLNLGCGPIQPEGWVNVDGSRRAWTASQLWWLDRAMVACRIWPKTEFTRQTVWADLLKRLSWADDSVDAVYMGEVLEHFTREDGTRLLKECQRVLRPGGILRLRVPDNARFWRNYLREFDACLASGREQWSESHTRWIQMFFRDICVRPTRIGSFGHFHKWMYDEVSLILALEKAGFESVERRTRHDSGIPGIEKVESHEDLTVEGMKPSGVASRLPGKTHAELQTTT